MDDISKPTKAPKKTYYEARVAMLAERSERQRPHRERCERDAMVFGLASAGFFALGVAAVFLGKYITYSGPGFEPAEVMSVFMFSAAGVLGFWASVKILERGT